MVFVVFFVLLSIIFPIFVGIKFTLSTANNKLFFKIKIYGLALINGYAKVIDDGIIIHLTKKKAILILKEDLFNFRGKVEPLKDYHLLKAKINITFGGEDNLLSATTSCFMINYFENFLRWILHFNKPYFRLNNSCNINLDLDYSIFDFNGQIVFNLLMIFLSLIKILIGKINYAISKWK